MEPRAPEPFGHGQTSGSYSLHCPEVDMKWGDPTAKECLGRGVQEEPGGDTAVPKGDRGGWGLLPAPREGMCPEV